MLRIEFEPPEHSLCECCGKTTTRLTRFVYKNDDAYAVYYANFTPQHPEKVLRGLISLGEWGDDNVGPEGGWPSPSTAASRLRNNASCLVLWRYPAACGGVSQFREA